MKSRKGKASSSTSTTLTTNPTEATIPRARCTPAQRATFDRLVLESGVSSTEYIVERCLQHKPRPIITEAAAETYQALMHLRRQLSDMKDALEDYQTSLPSDGDASLPDVLSQAKRIIDEIEAVTKQGQRELTALDDVVEDEDDEFDPDEAAELEP
jgi:hypothetical protein